MLCPEVQHTKSPGALERGGLCSELQKPVSSEQGMVARGRQHLLRHWVSLPGLLKQSATGWGASLTREIYLLMVLEAEVQDQGLGRLGVSRGRSLACRWPSSPGVLTSSLSVCLSPNFRFIRLHQFILASGPDWRLPLEPDYLFKDLISQCSDILEHWR